MDLDKFLNKMCSEHTVEKVSTELDVWLHICNVITHSPLIASANLISEISRVPVKMSRSTTTLGCYVSRGGKPCCIRIQFDQEPELIIQTLLHEIAHLLDHLVSFSGQAYRGAHRSGWVQWAVALGISPCRTGYSERLEQQRQQRKKLVAVCSGCGESFYRIRRLNRNRTYFHRQCGSPLKRI